MLYEMHMTCYIIWEIVRVLDWRPFFFLNIFRRTQLLKCFAMQLQCSHLKLFNFFKEKYVEQSCQTWSEEEKKNLEKML